MSHLATESLDAVEREAWSRNLKIIEKGRKAFWEFIGAVDEIRKKRLYRANYKTFDEFAEEKVGFRIRYLNELIEANRTRLKIGALAPETADQFRSEAQLSELKKVPETKLKEVVEAVAKKSPKPTAKQIAEVRDSILNPDFCIAPKTIDSPSVRPVIDAVVPKKQVANAVIVAPSEPVYRPADPKDLLKALLTKLDAVDALQIVLESLGTTQEQADILHLHFGDLTKQLIESATVGVMESQTECDIERIDIDKDSAQSLDNLVPQVEATTLFYKYGHAGREVIYKTISEAWENELNVYDGKKRAKNPRFNPPTVEEVAGFCRERGNSIDAEAFVAYYAARGWKLASGTKVADWKQCVITWEKRDKKRVEHLAELATPVDEMEEIRRRNKEETRIERERRERNYAAQRAISKPGELSPIKKLMIEREKQLKEEEAARKAKYGDATPEEIARIQREEKYREMNPDFDPEAARKNVFRMLAQIEAGEEITAE
jgi:hypothetical protein